MKIKNILRNLFYLFFPLIVGGVISFIIKDYVDYEVLTKPMLAPPSIVFPIVWTIIYFLMGISYYLLNNKYRDDITYENIIYYIQLFINAMWSIIFFLLKWRLVACIWIIILDLFVIYMVYLFYRKYKLSGILNIIYLCWILFATYLTIGVYILN